MGGWREKTDKRHIKQNGIIAAWKKLIRMKTDSSYIILQNIILFLEYENDFKKPNKYDLYRTVPHGLFFVTMASPLSILPQAGSTDMPILYIYRFVYLIQCNFQSILCSCYFLTRLWLRIFAYESSFPKGFRSVMLFSRKSRALLCTPTPTLRPFTKCSYACWI